VNTPCAALTITQPRYSAIWTHLLPHSHDNEEAAFLICRPSHEETSVTLHCVDFELMSPADFAVQLPYHFELRDSALGRLIKRAHQAKACLVEAHSHLGLGMPAFSASDLWGFGEVVPYVRWRLGGAPYGALVVTASGFTGLVWHGASDSPITLEMIFCGGRALRAALPVGTRTEESQ